MLSARKRPVAGLFATALALASMIGGAVYGPAEVPGISFSEQATALLAPAADENTGSDVDIIRHGGLRAALRGPTSVPLAPLIDGWENTDTRQGSLQVWCLDGSADRDARQDLRDALNWLQARFPSHVHWQESCANPAYTFGDTASQDCGTSQAIACAVYKGPHSGRVSINRSYTDGRPLLRRIAIAHEMQHIVLTIGHTQCGPLPDGEPSIMSPADLSTQRPCHTPAAEWLNEYDMRRAIEKYGLEPESPRATPTPTPTPRPVARVFLRRWWQPASGTLDPECTRTIANWCISDNAPFTVPENGTWVQIVIRFPDGREEGSGGFSFVKP